MEKPSNRKLIDKPHHHPKGKQASGLTPHLSTVKPITNNTNAAGNSNNPDEDASGLVPLPQNNKTDTELETDDGINKGTGAVPHDSDSLSNNQEKPGEKPGRGGGRFIIKNLWEVCCNEVESETKELNTILTKLGLPSVNYTKSKTYEITDYDIAPELSTCKSKDFLDFYVFPYLLPAIQALIQFARVNRVFQCRFCTFNALDYIVEYLYNNNPRYPERLLQPTPIFEIPFAKDWLEKHPRKAPPKWMLMSSEEAAIIIQRAIRGYMVRCRPDVQEMRQFWRDYRKDLEEERALYGRNLPKNFSTVGLFSPYYDELRGEFDSSGESPPGFTETSPRGFHSDQCVYCRAFRDFLNTQPDIGRLSQHGGGTGSKPKGSVAAAENGVPRLSVMDESLKGELENEENPQEKEQGSSQTGQQLDVLSVVPPPSVASKTHKSAVGQKKSITSGFPKEKGLKGKAKKQEG